MATPTGGAWSVEVSCWQQILKSSKTYDDIFRPSSPRIPPSPAVERDAESRVLIDSIGSIATEQHSHPGTASHLLRQWDAVHRPLCGHRGAPARLRELAILRTGLLCLAEYEWGQHAVSRAGRNL